jgi:hypothetical protein
MYGLDGVNATMAFILLVMTVGIMGSILTIMRIHRYRRFFIAMAYDAYLKVQSRSDSVEGTALVDATQTLRLALELDAWPNGRTAAFSYLAWIFGLAIIAFLPPMILSILPTLVLTVLIVLWAILVRGIR